MNINGSISIELMISFVIFLAFFGWIGLRRGAKRELIVLGVSLISWLVLQEKGDFLVRITNLGGRLLALIAAGGLSENGTTGTTATSSTQQLVTDTNESAFLFFIWVVIVIVTYGLTNKLISDKDSKSNGWAILWGIANGLFFASVFLPRLVLLFIPTETNPQTASQQLTETGRGSIMSFLSTGFQIVRDTISSFWASLGDLQPYVLLLLLTLFLILVYSSIRGAKIANLGGSGKSKC
jgi:hypothetical protein